MLQLLKPLVAEISSVPFPAGFWPSTKDSTPGELVAAIPSIPKSLVVGTVPCLRSPMPCVAPPVPSLVLPEMSRQTASSVLFVLPASSLMPGRTPPSGAATLLLRTPALR